MLLAARPQGSSKYSLFDWLLFERIRQLAEEQVQPVRDFFGSFFYRMEKRDKMNVLKC
jgi:6-phosphogluconate dehydrogenase